jgi:pimeloyl-ACP methyl ester carboxylesterase
MTAEPLDSTRHRQADIGGLPVFWRDVPGGGERTPLYLHGVPTSSDDFLPFLERTGGIAPDLPGFGRSGKPAAFDYSIAGYARFLEALVKELSLERLSLVVHDWGAVGLALPAPVLERVERVVVMNAVPLLPGYRWHRIARLWRTPVVGELAMGFTTRFGMRRLLREAFVHEEGPDVLTEIAWGHFDHGTQRAILKLYRSAPPERLARGGDRLPDLRCPALVAWGVRDPYLPTSFARAYADALGGRTRLELLDDAGHWPWVDRPDLVELVAAFIEGE